MSKFMLTSEEADIMSSDESGLFLTPDKVVDGLRLDRITQYLIQEQKFSASYLE
ncbi:MAG: hypothetical protein HQL26_03100 [Candidatus Omnitrophica bacterium]|nr:hypothetical protein [Candidatus Omnitrophota bacterium]